MSPKLEPKEDGEMDSHDCNEISFSTIEDSPDHSVSMPFETELKPVPTPDIKDLSENSHSKKCPWCKKKISWSGESNVFQEHRQACLSLVLNKNVVNKKINQKASVSYEPWCSEEQQEENDITKKFNCKFDTF